VAVLLLIRGHKVMTVAPRYEAYPDTESTGIIVPIRLFSDVERDAGNEKRLSKDAIEPNWHETDPSMPSHDKDELRENARANAFAELYDVNSINSNGVIRVFVDHPKLNTGKNIYNVLTYMEGSDLADLDVRYSILCQAALGAAVLHPELNDAGSRSSNDCGIVLVGNDWPTALLLLHLKHSIQDTQPHGDVLPHDTSCKYSKGDEYMDLLRRRLSSAGTVMCIHNLAYQGLFPLKVFERLCLPCNAFAPLSTSKDWKEFIVHQHSPNDGPCTSPCLQDNKGCADADEWQLSRSTPIHAAGGNLNFLRSALLVCDKIITVSPSYANEIQSPEMGYGLNDILSCRGVM
jgi:glycogen synthase